MSGYEIKEKFCNLHQHTYESHLDALCDIDDLFARVKELGQPAVAITDHGSMGGIYKAWKASQATGVKLIPGNEIYFVTNTDAKSKKDEGWKRYHLVLLAMNHQGYKNLLRISYEGFRNSIYIPVMNKVFPRVSEEVLRTYSEGIFCLSACGGNIIAQHILAGDIPGAEKYAALLKDIFGDRFYIELQPHNMERAGFSQIELNNKQREIALKLDIPLVATCDAHYIRPDDEKYHDMLLAIADKKPLEDLDRHTYTTDTLCEVCGGSGFVDDEKKQKCGNENCVRGVTAKTPCVEFYVKSEKEVFNFFESRYGVEQATSLIDNAAKIAAACEYPHYLDPGKKSHILKFDQKHINQSPDAAEFEIWRKKGKMKDAEDDVSYMKFLCEKGFRNYTKDMDKEKRAKYWQRLAFELDVYTQRDGFCSYMLMVADYIRWARDNDILVGPGRGSCGGSLAAFFMGIHQVDPIKYDLIFERFINLEKKSLPDVDTDFAPSGRERVFKYVQNKYGTEHVANISNLNRFTPKVVLKDVVRSLMIGGDRSEAFRIANAATAEIPAKAYLADGRIIEISSMEIALKHSRGDNLKNLIIKYPEVLDYVNFITGLPRNYSTHAAGVVISDVPLYDIAPMRRDKDGTWAVQYEKNGAEENQLVKMDFLGLTTLDVISDCIKQARAINLPVMDTYQLVDHTGDEGAYKVISNGLVLGCFQLEGDTLERMCAPMKPKSIEDISAINALGRPSCSDEERQKFIDIKDGKIDMVAPHPILTEILRPTNGISTYDEDLLRLSQSVAGWSLSKADGLRKLTKLKEKGAALADQLEADFIKDSMTVSKLSREDAQFIWTDVILPFSRYGFCINFDQDIVTSKGNVKIKDIRDGDLVLSYNVVLKLFEYKPVKNVWQSGEKETFEVEFVDGKKVRATLDHKFYRNGEWQTLGEIIKTPSHTGFDNTDELPNALGKVVKTESLGISPVFDMEIEDNHNFVLPGNIVAHNCKAHSIAYSMLGYMTAYYKYHARAPFFAASINAQMNKASTPEGKEYIQLLKQDAKKFGVSIDTCDINKSKKDYVAADPKRIVTGLNGVAGLGEKVLESIIAQQPYQGIEEFIFKNLAVLKRPHVESLAKSGAFDTLGLPRKFIHDNYAAIKEELQKFIKKADISFFDDGPERKMPRIEILDNFKCSLKPDGTDWELQEKLGFEKEVLGEFVSGSVADMYPGFFTNRHNEQSMSVINTLPDGTKFVVEGIIQGAKEIVIKKKGKNFNKAMAFIAIETLRGETFEATVFPDQWAVMKEAVGDGGKPIRGQFAVNEWQGNKSIVFTKNYVIHKGG